MDIQLVAVPYDSGRRGYRMGAGPEELLRAGLANRLVADGHTVDIVMLESEESEEVQSAFDLARQIATAVSDAAERGAFPVILAGNCSASVGGFAGLKSQPAMLWLDAHADFNTPETSESGFLDGMALAIMTGRCWSDQTYRIAGFQPLPESELVMMGVRSIDLGEKPALESVQIAGNQKELTHALAQLERDQLYLHIDLDALDPRVLPANHFATAGGLSREALRACLAAAHAKRIVAVAFTAYDPSADVAHAAPAIVLDALRAAIAP